MPAADSPGALEDLLDSLWPLRDYLAEITLIGGWVPELYRRYAGISEWRSRLSQTREADILVPQRVPRSGRDSIPEALRKAGFRPLHNERVSAAVWLGDPATGAKIEFLTGLTTPAMRLARTLPVGDQPGLGALALPDDLMLLERHSITLTAVWTVAGERRELIIRVPRLGAYIINKALTARGRPVAASAGSDKRSKDLLYLRDLMAAGPEIVCRISDDLAVMLVGHAETRRPLEAAQGALRTLKPADIDAAAEMLAERDRITHVEARFDVAGHLADLAELIAESLSGASPL